MMTTLKAYAGGLWRRAGEHDFMFMAGALSFSILVCIVPFVLIVFSIGGLMFERTAFVQQINGFIDVVVPYADTARFLKDIVATQAEEFREYKTVAGVAGLIGLFFASSALFSTIRSMFHQINPEAGARSLLVGKLHDIGMIALVMLLFLFAAAVLPAMQIIEHIAENTGYLSGTIVARVKPLIMDSVSGVTLFLILFAIHLLVPRARTSKSSAFVGACVTTVLWVVASWIFGAYIAHLANFQKVYGAYVLGIVVFFWIHYSSMVFIVGAEIGQIFRERRESKRAP